jgi:hypothetical protein
MINGDWMDVVVMFLENERRVISLSEISIETLKTCMRPN